MDAIDLAGGFTEDADQNQMNFSKLLADQEIIYVPKIGEEVPVINEVSPTGGGIGSNSETAKININTANAAELQQSSGIGAEACCGHHKVPRGKWQFSCGRRFDQSIRNWRKDA